MNACTACRIRIPIRIKVNGRIRIRLKTVWIRNKAKANFLTFSQVPAQRKYVNEEGNKMRRPRMSPYLSFELSWVPSETSFSPCLKCIYTEQLIQFLGAHESLKSKLCDIIRRCTLLHTYFLLEPYMFFFPALSFQFNMTNLHLGNECIFNIR